jgi:hypothetical protein
MCKKRCPRYTPTYTVSHHPVSSIREVDANCSRAPSVPPRHLPQHHLYANARKSSALSCGLSRATVPTTQSKSVTINAAARSQHFSLALPSTLSLVRRYLSLYLSQRLRRSANVSRSCVSSRGPSPAIAATLQRNNATRSAAERSRNFR